MDRRRKNKRRKFTSKMQASLLLVFCIVIIAFVALIGRLLYLNHEKGERYAKRALSQKTYVSKVMPFQRGDITDRNQTKLATSERVYNVILDPKNILEEKTVLQKSTDGKSSKKVKMQKYRNSTVNALTQCFSVSREEIDKILKEMPDSQYVVLLKELSYEEINKFNKMADKDKNIQGVWFEKEYKRIYPMQDLACKILGFTEEGNVGRWGMEEYYNEELNGTNGREYGYFNSDLKLERKVKPAVNGNTVVSTIDANIQQIVEKHLKKFNKDTGAKNSAVIVANPKNGEIYAMASYPFYNLNNPRNLEAFHTKDEIKKMNNKEQVTELSKMWRNFCISDIFEPGSTFKTFTVSAGLEEAKVKDGDKFVCDGREKILGRTITCNNGNPHGTITLEQAIMKSCNDALMNIGKKVGRKQFAKYEKVFGFGTKTGIDLPGEGRGLILTEEQLNPVELATCSFGQSNSTTMVQILAAFCSVINGGKYYQPHVVKQILNEKGGTVKSIDPVLVRETVSHPTAELLKQYMYSTVEDGTAKEAQIKGYRIGGKTGTAQKRPLKDKKFVVSFIEFTPIDDPQVVVYTVVDEPDVSHQADSRYAKELSSAVMKEILPFLDIFPDPEKEKEDEKKADKQTKPEE